jgi:hypothetical protein
VRTAAERKGAVVVSVAVAATATKGIHGTLSVGQTVEKSSRQLVLTG